MANIPKDFKDYDPDDPDIEFRKKRFEYWTALKKVRTEFLDSKVATEQRFDIYDFEQYLEDQYGLKINVWQGNITDGFTIVDEKKYLIFILRFGDGG